MTLEQIINSYSSDASRLALASSGDNLDDANFDLTTVNAAILKLSELEQWIQTTMKNINTFREKGQGDDKANFYD